MGNKTFIQRAWPLLILALAWPAFGDPATPVDNGITLALAQAIQLAIQNNLTAKLAKAGTDEARGNALQEAANLLPQLTATASQQRFFKTNLAAEGFASFPIAGFNPVIGPYDSFDARLHLVQNLLDLNAVWEAEAGRSGRKIAQYQERLAREQVAAAAALAYLEAQRTRRAVTSAQADQKLSESLLKLARDQHSAGISTGVDVARAETDSAQENLRLIRAVVDAQDASVRLKRVIGLPMDQAISLQDLPPEEPRAPNSIEKAIGQALTDRAELQISQQFLQQTTYELRAAKSQDLPTLSANADYGFSGTTPNDTARTGSIGGFLNLPLFSGGDTHGLIVQQQALWQEAQDRDADAHAQVEEDVRLALQALSAATEETKTADQALQLAQEELKMAKDRFAAGAGDNIQVLTAQTSLARAYDDQVDALAHYDTARVNLATALGHIQEFR